jgi:hypothetical protein
VTTKPASTESIRLLVLDECNRSDAYAEQSFTADEPATKQHASLAARARLVFGTGTPFEYAAQ